MRVFNELAKLLGGIQLPGGAGAGKVLVSDASGNGTWGSVPGMTTVVIPNSTAFTAQANTRYVNSGSTGPAITIPAGSSLPVGAAIEIVNATNYTGALAVACTGSDTMYYSAASISSTFASYSLGYGESVRLINLGGGAKGWLFQRIGVYVPLNAMGGLGGVLQPEGRYIVSGSGNTGSLPQAPPNSSEVEFIFATTSSVTISRSGSDRFGVGSGYNGPMVIAGRPGEAVKLVYQNGFWYQASGPPPVSIGGLGTVPTSIPPLATGQQPGVVNANDLSLQSLGIAPPSGNLTLQFAGGMAWTQSSSGVLIPTNLSAMAASATWTPPSLPPSGSSMVVSAFYNGQDVYPGNGVTLVCGAAVAGNLNTAALILAHAPATPAGQLRLYDFTIYNNAGSYAYGDGTTSIRPGINYLDRRPWARGGYNQIVRTSNASSANDYTTTSAALVNIDSTNLAIRMECSGVPVKVSLRGRASNSSANAWNGFAIAIDGTSQGTQYAGAPGAAAGEFPLDFEWDFTPAAGSHLFVPQYAGGVGTTTVMARSSPTLQFVVEEIVRQNANNGTV